MMIAVVVGTAVRCAHSSHSVDTHTRYNDVQNTGGRITCMLIRARHKATVKLTAAAETKFFLDSPTVQLSSIDPRKPNYPTFYTSW